MKEYYYELTGDSIEVFKYRVLSDGLTIRVWVASFDEMKEFKRCYPYAILATDQLVFAA